MSGIRFTHEDYLLLPEGKRYEIIDGELLAMPSPNVEHQRIVGSLAAKLFQFVVGQGLGWVVTAPADVILSKENVVQPDVLFVSKQRAAIIDWNGGVHGAPDLTVEVMGPCTSDRDRLIKRYLYAGYGVREYWIADPDAGSVEVLTLAKGGVESRRFFPAATMLCSKLLTGLSIPLAEVFAD